jgi:FkbM family methyltransferase
MKKVYEYWLPDTDTHFEGQIARSVKDGGPAQYQHDIRTEAYKYVTDFNLCVDVGANVGLWTKQLSQHFKKVIAFEPIAEVFKCLEKNVADLCVDLNCFALGNANSTVDLVYNCTNTGATYVDKSSLGIGAITVKRLDDLKLPKFGMIKLDCEQYEIEVLKGAIETILMYKPIIVCEQHVKVKDAGNFLKELGAKEITSIRKDYIFGW